MSTAVVSTAPFACSVTDRWTWSWRAVTCAAAMGRKLRALGLEVRAAMHTGELELRDGDIGGIAVHIASRIMGLARPNEVLVSSTVKDLVPGADIRFEDRSVHSLRGVPGQWQLFAAFPGPGSYLTGDSRMPTLRRDNADRAVRGLADHQVLHFRHYGHDSQQDLQIR